MINPITNKLYATYSGSPTLSIIDDQLREQNFSSDYFLLIGIVVVIVATGASFIVVKKRKIKL